MVRRAGLTTTACEPAMLRRVCRGFLSYKTLRDVHNRGMKNTLESLKATSRNPHASSRVRSVDGRELTVLLMPLSL